MGDSTKKSLYYAGFLCLCLSVSNSFAEGAAKKIVKWKDDKGVVHYGDAMPSHEAGRGNAELNAVGVTVRRNETYKEQSHAAREAEVANAEQLRKDSAYSSIEEIDFAMARNLQTEEGNLNVLQQRLVETKKNLTDKQALHDKSVKARQGNINYLADEVQMHQQKLAKINADILATKNNIALTQTRYAGYKTRYAELRPRNQSLSKINVSKKNLAELEQWKLQANQKLNSYLDDTVRYKRSGEPIPNHVTEGIQQANQEIARADQEIAAIKANIKDTQQAFSSR